ncbi:MAG: DUF4862 family protein [Elusimicrobia bacterium]|nr:DUF4862 family protein [Elusimicrobiota bacterium]
MRLHLAAYAATAPGPFDPAGEGALYEALAGLPLAGLEQPFFGSLHRHDEGWLLGRLKPGWTFVLTTLPGTMERLKANRRFGLASRDEGGRHAALGFMEEARQAVGRLNARMGRPSVLAVELHSAPRPDPCPERFAESLRTLASWDWSGATLMVEHCDAARPDGAHDKGFLSLKAELAVVQSVPGAAVSLNWGRSALEGRSERTPLEHIAAARSAGLLGALFFSGVTPAHPDYGAWRDSHAPFSTACPESLLTPADASKAVSEARGVPLVGLKIQPLPASLGLEDRLGVLQDALAVFT